MTTRATLWRVHFPVMYKARKLCLTLLVSRTLPSEIVDFFWRTNILLGVAVTIQAKAHTQRLCMMNNFHLINASMTFHTANTSINVNSMVEVNIIRCLMDTHPRNGLSGFIALAYLR